MDIVNERTARVLQYLEALGRQGVHPSASDVNAFGTAPDPTTIRTPSVVETLNALQAHWRYGLDERVEEETYSAYLLRLGWAVNSAAGMRLTKTGRAVVAFNNAPVLESAEDLEVVLRPDDRFAYARLVHRMAQVPEAMLVEPYLRLDQYIEIAELENITRFMVGPRIGSGERASLARALRAADPNTRPEFRVSTNLHDRYLLPKAEGHQGLMLGVSINGVGRTVTTLVALSETTTAALTAAFRDLWESAEPLVTEEQVQHSADVPVSDEQVEGNPER